jgi:hypothetical protein
MTLELVVIFPIVLLLFITVIQAAVFLHARNLAMGAAQEGLRAATVRSGSAGEGQAQASAFIAASGPDILQNPNAAVNRGAERATITVTGESLAVLPGLNFSVTATASGPVERFTNN